jgi:hypothetical protein
MEVSVVPKQIHRKALIGTTSFLTRHPGVTFPIFLRPAADFELTA